MRRASLDKFSKQNKFFFILTFLCLFGSFSLSGCGSRENSGGAGTAAPPLDIIVPLCDASKIVAIKVLDNSNQSLEYLSLEDIESYEFKLGAMNECGDLSSTIDADSFSLNTGRYGYLTSVSGSTTQLKLNKGPTLIEEPLILSANALGLSTQIEIEVSYTLSNIAKMYRWYKADSFENLSDGTLIGDELSLPLFDSSPNFSNFNAYSPGSRKVHYRPSIFSKPTLELCGKDASCSGVNQNQALRIASSFDSFANTDLTLVSVVARATSDASFVLSNQSSGNNTGTFLGWTSNTNFRFSISGPNGSTKVDATVPAYSGVPTLEVISARLDTQSGSMNPGLQVYINEALVTQNPGVTAQQLTATTIPYIGTQRSDNNSGHFYVSEFIVYKRALDNSELQAVIESLKSKHGIL